MKRQPRILAGTAIGLLMASAPLGAYPLQGSNNPSHATPAPVILAQADCEPGAEGCSQPEAKPRKKEMQRRDRDQGESGAAPERSQKAERRKQVQEQAEPAQAEQAPAEEPEVKPRKQKRQAQEQQAQPRAVEPGDQVAEPEQKPRKQKRQAQEQQAEPQAEQAAEPEQKPRKQKRQAQEQQAEPQAEQPSEQAAEPKGGKEKLRKFLKNKQEGGQTEEQQAAPAQGEQPSEQAGEPQSTKEKLRQLREKKKQGEPQQAEQPSKEEQSKQAEQGKPGKEAKPEQPAQAEQAPAEGEKPAEQAGEPKSKKDKLRQFLKNKQNGGGEEQAEPEQAEQPTPEGQPKQAEQGKPGKEQAAPEQNAGEPAAKQAEGGEQQATKPVLPRNIKEGKQRRQERVKEEAEAKPLPENAAPVFDSAKRGRKAGQQKAGQQEAEQPPIEQQQNGQAEAEAPPPPDSDAAAQEAKIAPADVESLLVEQGERFEPTSREERRQFRRERREQRENVQVVKQYNDNRTIVEINNQFFVESPDNDRIILRDDEVYYDELPHGRTREVITRPNGVKVITIRNRYGDIIRRSRVLPDGDEVLLVYVPDERLEDVADWEDPAADLPPLRLTVPINSYILEADTVEDTDRYYEFFEQPPIAEIPRIYSIDEVKRSARLRDTMPRVDLDTINFETGSAEIGESEVDELDAIAQAILKVLKDNPGETFLIEGHTDAVGSAESNLVLSDRRAEAVAQALTSVYEIPPENLVTQGYGEQYLKVATDGPNRENRRVAMRRITPLVAPVASAQ